MSEPIKTLYLESCTPKLAYDFRGGIEPVLLCIHGNSSHRGVWGPLLDHLPEHAVLRLDLRGHGESEWASPPAYSTAESAKRQVERARRRRAFPDVGETRGSGA